MTGDAPLLRSARNARNALPAGAPDRPGAQIPDRERVGGQGEGGRGEGAHDAGEMATDTRVLVEPVPR